MPTSLDIDQWSTQLRKGLAELCVLAAVERLGEAYGYQLVQFLTEHDGLSLTESTVYPLLARLARKATSALPPRRHHPVRRGAITASPPPADGRSQPCRNTGRPSSPSIQKIVDPNSSPEK